MISRDSESIVDLVHLLDSLPLIVLLVDEERRVRRLNDMALTLTGGSRHEVLNLRGGEAIRCVVALSSENGCGYSKACDQCGVRNSVLETIETRRGLSGVEATLTRETANGPFTHHLFVSTSPVIYHGEAMVLVVLDDITEKKRNEEALLRTQEQLLQSQKLEAVGRLAGGIAHDFNNMLAAIMGYSDLLESSMDEKDPRHLDVVEIHRCAQRAAEMTRKLLAFSRKQRLNTRRIDLNEVIDGIHKLLPRLIGEDVEAHLDLDAAIGCIEADTTLVEQVIINLVVNARDAMPGGGTLKISTSTVDVSEKLARRLESPEVGPHVLLTVQDSGSGIDPALLDRIFEPFFTTKEIGKGTGLGLSTVFGIVHQFRGAIDVESEMGAGTSFKIYLPSAPGAPAQERSAAQMKHDLRGNEVVLVVEDEDILRRLLERILTKAGYSVLLADSGEEALGILARRVDRVHLVITDIVMPGIDGIELSRRVLESGQKTRVLLTSGYLDRVRESLPDLPFIEKPFEPAKLLAMIRDVLDS